MTSAKNFERFSLAAGASPFVPTTREPEMRKIDTSKPGNRALIHEKAKLLMREEGYGSRQAHAIATSMLRAGRLGKDLTYYSVEEFPDGPRKAKARSKARSKAKPASKVKVVKGSKDGRVIWKVGSRYFYSKGKAEAAARG